MYFTIYRGRADKWRWNLRAANHHVIAQGEDYHNKADALRAIDLVRSTSRKTPIREPGGKV